jgi:D-alanyl-D-alanine carboxypeptidase
MLRLSWIAVLVLTSPVVAAEPPAAPLAQQLQAKADLLLATHSFPGVSVGVALADGSTIAAASGLADVEGKVSLKPTDRLLAGSIGKTFVAAVALQLVEEGKLGLDDPASKWLGKEAWFTRLPNNSDLTVRTLLNHSSGLPEYFEGKAFPDSLKKDPDTPRKPEDLLAFVFDRKPLFAVGKGWAYSDTDYVVVGLIVEKVMGKPLFDEITARLLVPLKLDRTIPSDKRTLPETAVGYSMPRSPFGVEGRMIRDGKFVFNPQFEYAGGGLASTPGDLAKWAKALYEGKAFQKKETLDALLTGVDSPAVRGGGKNQKYGLGVQIRETEWGTSYGHGGWFPGYRSEVEYFPKYKTAIAVQINTDAPRTLGKGPTALLREVAAMLLNDPK